MPALWQACLTIACVFWRGALIEVWNTSFSFLLSGDNGATCGAELPGVYQRLIDRQSERRQFAAARGLEHGTIEAAFHLEISGRSTRWVRAIAPPAPSMTIIAPATIAAAAASTRRC
jgi:hypothetical protein